MLRANPERHDARLTEPSPQCAVSREAAPPRPRLLHVRRCEGTDDGRHPGHAGV